jgi:hypothetical protein
MLILLPDIIILFSTLIVSFANCYGTVNLVLDGYGHYQHDISRIIVEVLVIAALREGIGTGVSVLAGGPGTSILNCG